MALLKIIFSLTLFYSILYSRLQPLLIRYFIHHLAHFSEHLLYTRKYFTLPRITGTNIKVDYKQNFSII